MGITISTAPLGTMSTGGETTSTTESKIIHGTIMAIATCRQTNLVGNGKTINGKTMLVRTPMMITTTRKQTTPTPTRTGLTATATATEKMIQMFGWSAIVGEEAEQ